MTAKTAVLGARNIFGNFAELFQHLLLVFGPELISLGTLFTPRLGGIQSKEDARSLM